MRKPFLAVLFLAVFSASASAQPLIQHVPDDAALYIGWRGVNDLGEAYDGSNLKALKDTTDLPAVTSQLLSVIEKASNGDADAKMVLDLIRTIGGASWRNPTAAYLQQTSGPDAKFPIRFVVLWDDQGDALLAELARMIDQAPPDAPLHAERQGDMVTLTIGTPTTEGADGLDLGPAGSLAQNPRFKQTLAHVQPDGVLVVYADGAALVSLIDTAVEADGIPQEIETWSKVRSATGLSGLNALAWSASFDGPDWRVDGYIDAPSPRKGFLTLFDGKPITEQELSVVPASATWMLATRLDLAALLDETRRALTEIDPQLPMQMDGALGMVSGMTAVDIETDLIRALGSAWVVYTDPGAIGSGSLGFCLVNTLSDAEKFEQALLSLQTTANMLMSQWGDQDFTVKFLTAQDGSGDGAMTVHSLGFPFVAPTWSVYEGSLYVGLYPQSVLAAGDFARAHAQGGGDSIVTNPRYQQVRARLGNEKASSILFADLPQTAAGSYQNLVFISQLGSGMIAMAGGDAMPMLLPPFNRLEPYLAPAGKTAWSDEQGYHVRAISPFPGAMLLGPQTGSNMTFAAPMAVGILLPALGAARRTAMQMQSLSNARQIEVMRIMYAAEHGDEFPGGIGVLWRESNLQNAELFLSKASGKRAPPQFADWPQPRQEVWIRQNSSYIFVPTPPMDEDQIPSETISLFENPRDSMDPEKIAVGFNDGHIESIDTAQARRRIKAQTGMTLEVLIQHQQVVEPAP